MSCCGCGSSCKCRINGWGGCSMYPYIADNASAQTITVEGAIASLKMFHDEMGAEGSDGNGCKCGSSCTCDPCSCK